MRQFIVIFFLSVFYGMAASAGTPQPELKTTALIINTATQSVHFTVEEALTPDEQEYGLMFRQSLDKHRGMLFVLPTAQPISMWMKNTLIPLDMVFIASDGSISNIAQNTTPQSLDAIPSKGKVSAVLEVAAGVVKQYHIAPGDHVMYSVTP